MDIPIKTVILCGAMSLLMHRPAQAWPGDGCRFKAQREQQVALSGARRIVIRAGAGDLTIHGIQGAAAVKAHGKACAPTEALLTGTDVAVRHEGDAIVVSSVIPTHRKQTVSILWPAASPSIDIDVELPDDLPLSLEHTSGDTKVLDIAGGSIRASSGDLAVHGVTGDLDVVDGSGDLLVDGVGGRLSLDDSSGDIVIRHVKGNVLVRNDSSGDIDISNAGADVTIGNDSSGDVNIREVAGNFTLEAKGSGEVSVHGVDGQVKIPEYKK